MRQLKILCVTLTRIPFFQAANIGELRNNHDPSCTYEGDNNVLGQQASNWLLRQWENGVESPAGTANFINNRAAIAEKTFISLNDLFKNDSKKCTLCQTL